jgi:hypothetical protein
VVGVAVSVAIGVGQVSPAYTLIYCSVLFQPNRLCPSFIVGLENELCYSLFGFEVDFNNLARFLGVGSCFARFSPQLPAPVAERIFAESVHVGDDVVVVSGFIAVRAPLLEFTVLVHNPFSLKSCHTSF